jgi:hypothetical protein
MVDNVMRVYTVIQQAPRRTWAFLATAALLLPTPDPSLHGQEVAGLTALDFMIGGLEQATDAGAAREVFGLPDSTATRTLALAAAPRQVTDWFYPGLVLEVTEMGLVNAITLTSSEWSTERRLRVGELAGRVRRLYGDPHLETGSRWIYQDPRNAFRVISVRIEAGVVTQIRVGSVYELTGD